MKTRRPFVWSLNNIFDRLMPLPWCCNLIKLFILCILCCFVHWTRQRSGGSCLTLCGFCATILQRLLEPRNPYLSYNYQNQIVIRIYPIVVECQIAISIWMSIKKCAVESCATTCVDWCKKYHYYPGTVFSEKQYYGLGDLYHSGYTNYEKNRLLVEFPSTFSQHV